MIPHGLIRSALRKLWWERSDIRKAAKNASRVSRGQYLCAKCGGLTKKPELDHVCPVGATPGSKRSKPEDTWDVFMDRLFNGEIQTLCRDCHLAKGKGAA